MRAVCYYLVMYLEHLERLLRGVFSVTKALTIWLSTKTKRSCYDHDDDDEGTEVSSMMKELTSRPQSNNESDNDSRENKHEEPVYSQDEARTLVLGGQNNQDEINACLRSLNNQSSSSSSIKALTLTSSSSSSRNNCHGREPDWNSDSIRELFMDVASLCPHLESLSLNNFGMHCNSLPLHLLNVLLATTQAPLRYIQLNCVCLIGTQADANEMAHQLETNQPQLETFQMSYCGFSTAMTCTLDPVVVALSTLPGLRSVELWSYADGRLGSLQPHSLERLLQRSSKLQSLHIEGFLLDDDQVQSIASALPNNTSLQRLDLHKITQAPLGSLALAESLRHNTTLQYLEVFLANTDNTDNGGDQTTTEEDGFLTKLAQALSENSHTSLQELRFHSYRTVTALEEEAFATMLETNRSLHFVHLAGYEGDNRPKMEYFLSWNRRGRNPACILQDKCQITAMVKSRQQQQRERKDPQKRKKQRRVQRLMRP